MYKNLNIAVIGDIMLDHWREGSTYKLNPEAPTIDITNPGSEYTLGGAGNVAKIIAGLGAKAYLVGALGATDGPTEENVQFRELCSDANIVPLVVFEEDCRTTVKERIICDGQQICRVSREDTHFISLDTATRLAKYIAEIGRNANGIIIADYAKGVMRDQLIRSVLQKAKENNIPVLVDPKDRLYIYRGCTIMKPNREEYDKLHKRDGITHHWSVNVDFLECEHLVITDPGKIAWWSADKTNDHVHCENVEVANVSGCGDAVAAVLLLEYIRNGGDIKGAVELANWGASCVVQQERTGHLTIEDLVEFGITGGYKGHEQRGEVNESNISG